MNLEEFRKKGLFKRVRGMERSRHNLMTSRILYKISTNEEAKESLLLSTDFKAFDWVIITSFYAMYHSALAVLANLGYKSNNHTATILALEYFFVRKGKLEKDVFKKIKRAKKLEAEYIRKIKTAKKRREIVQYNVTTVVEERIADTILKDADEFIKRIEKLLSEQR